MQIENLKKTDITRLTEVVEELKESNPLISYRIFPMGNDPKQVPDSTQAQLSQIQADLDQLKSKVDRIFGEYVLINGRWTILK